MNKYEKIDYSQISMTYDFYKKRHIIERDELINAIYTENGKQITVLDLSCGTGNYLKTQISYFPKSDYNIQWTGIDKSKAMLNKAKEKAINADLIIGEAEDMPIENCQINFIKNRFSFQHYNEKEKSVFEMHRVLKIGGRLNMLIRNLEYTQKSWVNKFFPSSAGFDKNNFPDTFDLLNLFEAAGFKVSFTIKINIQKNYFSDIIEIAQNRAMSQLYTLDDNEYETGINNMILASKESQYIISDIAISDILCEKA
jgi:ubiquinone/menaquinone biosynthesis C-methylase UbiE